MLRNFGNSNPVNLSSNRLSRISWKKVQRSENFFLKKSFSEICVQRFFPRRRRRCWWSDLGLKLDIDDVDDEDDDDDNDDDHDNEAVSRNKEASDKENFNLIYKIQI